MIIMITVIIVVLIYIKRDDGDNNNGNSKEYNYDCYENIVKNYGASINFYNYY